jgi:hypothetical protein
MQRQQRHGDDAQGVVEPPPAERMPARSQAIVAVRPLERHRHQF